MNASGGPPSNRAIWCRTLAGYLAAVCAVVGAWAQFAPRSFYDDFPGLGMVWVAPDGPYNEHLVRDVGGLNLALAVVGVVAAVSMRRTVISAFAAATLVYGTPHLVYHVLNTEGLDGGDAAASIIGLVLFAAVGVALLVISRPPARIDDRSESPTRLR